MPTDAVRVKAEKESIVSFKEDHALETYKSMISVSVEGFKTLLLINGGAVVAMLAYLGQSPSGRAVAPHTWIPLGFFVAGVALCALTFVGSYVTQFFLFNESVNNRPDGRHMAAVWTTAGVVVLSVMCFIAGAVTSLHILSQYAR